jgi:hypothetical protein
MQPVTTEIQNVEENVVMATEDIKCCYKDRFQIGNWTKDRTIRIMQHILGKVRKAISKVFGEFRVDEF